MTSNFSYLLVFIFTIGCSPTANHKLSDIQSINTKAMQELLTQLFENSIEFGDVKYTKKQVENKWIGNPPATAHQIYDTEQRLNINLPKDYISLILVSNGFQTSLNDVEPSFLKIEDIDFYSNYEYRVTDTWKEMGLGKDIMEELERSILVAGTNQDQQFLLIPPLNDDGKWQYWKFANWIPGEEKYLNLTEYLKELNDYLETSITENP